LPKEDAAPFDLSVRPDIAKNLHPVRFIPTDDPLAKPIPGIGLCLSGGGYRAMIFHLGALWRLNELGLLRKVKRVSSVSGGSLTAGRLGLMWNRLSFDAADVATNLEELVVRPLRNLASQTIDIGAVLCGKLLPWKTVPEVMAAIYRKHLYGTATLQDLPSDAEGPRFVLNATSLQTTVLWRFSKPFMGDYRVGLIRNPKLELATAVAASGAGPPFLSPVELKPNPADFDPTTNGGLQFPPYTTDIKLTDGGVYDNLGLETVWKIYDTILVSDGGAATPDEPRPKSEWFQQTYRVLMLMDNQVGSLRTRQLIAAYQLHLRKGTYWGIRTNILNYGLSNALNCPFNQTLVLANTPTRLKAMDAVLQERLINWGYAVCDAGIRAYVAPGAPPPPGFPYPAAGVG
jgi:NTE family protein